MTKRAFERVIAEKNFMPRLGLPNKVLFGGKPVDVILQGGATDEDSGNRPLNHFYDPVHDLPLLFKDPKFCANVKGGDFTTRDWALNPVAGNEYGVTAAKHWLVLAMTSSTGHDRQTAFFNLFTSLGHLMHLVQDMGQPQHTRNDGHPISEGPIIYPKAWLSALNLWSRYELWCKIHLGGNGAASYYDSYPVVKLPSYANYFKGEWKGLADYSNANFVTEHTNYSDSPCPPVYAEPSLSRTSLREENDTVSYFHNTGYEVVPVTKVVQNRVLSFPTQDLYTGTEVINQNHTVYSYFDYDLGSMGSKKIYSQSPKVLSSQAAILVRRAVGYSAGFLSHFFRGSVTAQWLRNTDGTYNLTVTNTSEEPIFVPRLSVYYRVAPGTHTAPAGLDLVQIADAKDLETPTLAPGASATLSFLTIPGLTIGENVRTYERRLVVTGKLGNELNAVIPLVQPAEAVKQSFNFDAWTAGQAPGFYECGNIANGDRFGAMNACVLYAPDATKVPSAVYGGMSHRVTFWWGTSVRRPRFRLINGEKPMKLYLTYSPAWYCECPKSYKFLTLAPYEQIVIQSDLFDVQRFDVVSNTRDSDAGPYWIDDVEWEVFNP